MRSYFICWNSAFFFPFFVLDTFLHKNPSVNISKPTVSSLIICPKDNSDMLHICSKYFSTSPLCYKAQLSTLFLASVSQAEPSLPIYLFLEFLATCIVAFWEHCSHFAVCVLGYQLSLSQSQCHHHPLLCPVDLWHYCPLLSELSCPCSLAELN